MQFWIGMAILLVVAFLIGGAVLPLSIIVGYAVVRLILFIVSGR